MDNLLLKLAEKDVPFLRIGRLSQVEQRLHAWTPGGSHYPDTSVSSLRATAQAARVVSSLPVLSCVAAVLATVGVKNSQVVRPCPE